MSMAIRRYMAVLILAVLFAGCGKVTAPASTAPPSTLQGERVCSADSQRCYGVTWVAGPADSEDNSVAVSFDESFRSEQFRNAGGKVFAQMTCCGTIKEGQTRVEADGRVVVEKLELWPGDWLLVIETVTDGVKTQVSRKVTVK